jgi:hypothetical protein
MSAEPINVHAVLTQWLRNLANHTRAKLVEPDLVLLESFPCKYFQTKFMLGCVPDQETLELEDGPENEPDEAVEGCAADDVADVEEAAGAYDIAVTAVGTADTIKYTDLRATSESLVAAQQHTDVYVEILVTSPLAKCVTQPATLSLFQNGDVEISYYIPTRSRTRNWVRMTIHGTSIEPVTNMFLRLYSTHLKDRLVPKVVAAAVRVKPDEYTSHVYAVPAPQRHNHAIKEAARAGSASTKNPVTQEMQGFLLSNGRFADRKTALACAVLSGQLPDDSERTELFSEDLW